MSTIDTMIESYTLNRKMTDRVMERIAQQASPDDALRWRPGADRAHLAWQLMHIGITEEIFATERLDPDKPGQFTELWGRFRGGSTPDDNIPALDQVREVLNQSRANLLETLSRYSDDRLGEIPTSLAERGWTVRDILNIISWHESHHQGQAHLTLNLYENR